MVSELDSWKSFLPPGGWVMARRRPSPAEAASISTSEPEASPAVQELSGPASGDSAQALAEIGHELAGCTRCKLCTGRKTIVLGEGNPKAELLFIGEGPGEQEDIQGRPFVGKAGQLLDKMIEAMGLTRSQVFIANVVKCRPPGNRNPEPDEIAACGPFLYRQVAAIRPKIVVALGKFSAQTVLNTDERISSLRGHFREIERPIPGSAPLRLKVMPTWHPAYLLRNPASKREAWIDLQAVARELGIQIPKKTS